MKGLDYRIEGGHPYFRELGAVAIDLSLLVSVPGVELKTRHEASVEERRDDDAWSPLAGPYQTVPGGRISLDEVLADNRALLALVWDLQGRPIHPDLGRRPALEFAAVINDDCSIVIWRRSTDMLHSRDVKTEEIRSADRKFRVIRREDAA